MLLTFPDGTLYRSEAIAALPPLRYDWEAKRWILRVMLFGGHTLVYRGAEGLTHEQEDEHLQRMFGELAKHLAA